MVTCAQKVKTKVQLILKLVDGQRKPLTLTISTKFTLIKKSKLLSLGMDILLKLLLINQDNQFKLFTLSMPLMDIKQEPLIMVFNSISMRDLNIQ